jgi:nondiscriminating glutamyl-tRNA synthetase
MHLGNIRAAIINALFARQQNGTYILRIEDTDTSRLHDPHAEHIIADLAWLNLTYDEGPQTGGPCAPYFQSERTAIYTDYLDTFREQGAIYRCFATQEELTALRKEQKAQSLPPRYKRERFALSPEAEQQKLENNEPFVWRFAVPGVTIYLNDLTRGSLAFDLNHFSDFPITRQDGSFTFLFTNFVDDLTMDITHVFRGEDHLSNSALQYALYQACDATPPVFYHLPIIVNTDGKKLSKRDFGFSLNDLKESGFLPEAIINYLAILGGTFTQEIMNIPELVNTIDFQDMRAAGTITYDVEKLRWVNQHWIQRLDDQDVAQRVKPFLDQAYDISSLETKNLIAIIGRIKSTMTTLYDPVNTLAFCFHEPQISDEALQQYNISEHIPFLDEELNKHIESITDADAFLQSMKAACKAAGKPLRDIFSLIRIALTGNPQGLPLKDIIELLGAERAKERLQILCQ